MSGHRQRWEWESLYCKVWCMYYLLNLFLCLFFAWCRKWRPEGWNAEEVWAFSASCWALPRLSLYSALHGENTLLLSKPIFHMQNRQKWEEAYRLAVRLKAPGNSTFYITTSNTFMFLICFLFFWLEVYWQPLCISAHFLINFCSQISSGLFEFDKSFASSGSPKIMWIQKKRDSGCRRN